MQRYRAGLAVVSAVNADTAATPLAAANRSRLGLLVYNDSSADLYLKFGSGASATDYSVKIGGGGYYEVPFEYDGIVTGAWASATGVARVTEFKPYS